MTGLIDDANNATATELSLADTELFLLNLTIAVRSHTYAFAGTCVMWSMRAGK
jgi:hypothetical protein